MEMKKNNIQALINIFLCGILPIGVKYTHLWTLLPGAVTKYSGNIKPYGLILANSW